MKFKSSTMLELKEMLIAHEKRFIYARDDYWEFGFLPDCEYYEILDGEISIGFFAVNHENILTQFYVDDKKTVYPEKIFDFVLSEKGISSAYVETSDNQYFVLAAERAKTTDLFFRIYENMGNFELKKIDGNIDMKLATLKDFYTLIDFQTKALDDATVEFLNWYTKNWIKNEGIYIFSKDGKIIGTGELRVYDENKDVAFSGVIIGRDYRKQGYATYVLSEIQKIIRQRNLKSFSSIEKGNVGSDKAMRNVGFCPVARIFKMTF